MPVNTEQAKSLRSRTKPSRRPTCRVCKANFRDKKTLDAHVQHAQHRKAKHEPEESRTYDCNICVRTFPSQQRLNEHYRGSPAHPTCPKCGLGFENEMLCTEHGERTHIPVACLSCDGRNIYKEDLPSHYLDSPNHPKCTICKTGFVDDKEFKVHSEVMHETTRCELCECQYSSRGALEQHYHSSHQRPVLSSPEPLETEAESMTSSSIDTNIFDHASLETGENLPLLHDRLTSAPIGLGTNAVQSPKKTLSSIGEEMAEKLLTEVDVPRFSNNPTPTNIEENGRSLDPLGTKRKNEWAAAFSPATSGARGDIHATAIKPDRSPLWLLNAPSFPPSDIDSPDVQSPSGLATLPAISPAASSPISQSSIRSVPYDAWAHWNNPYERLSDSSSLPKITTSELSPVGMKRADSINSVFSSLERDVLRHGLTDLRLVAPPNPALGSLYSPMGALSPLNTRTSYTNTNGSQPESKSFVPRTSRSLDSSISSDEGISSESSVYSSATKVASSSLHCRLCLLDPCVNATATMCGHIFCGECITASVLVSSKCPVCQNALLLYCLFKLDLSS